MGWKNKSGKEVAYKILEAYRFAQLDPFRAATHNKGIMNGIDAVAIATGQDWRAIEASVHAYASKHNYQPLNNYQIVEVNNQLIFK
jgi:degradative hydroxymethylglutaryl-CoA reductase